MLLYRCKVALLNRQGGSHGPVYELMLPVVASGYVGDR